MANDKYNEIINLEHHVSKKHKQMSLYDRAAQFASFAALNGFEESVEEVARKTERRIELDDSQKEEIINKVLYIYENKAFDKKYNLTWFEKDRNKEGGRYISADVKIDKIDTQNGILFFNDAQKIRVDDIIEIL